jgi:hypothetical protein
MKSKELKIAEQLTNACEDHYFNPAVFGRYLSDQPFYTVDRIMEMLVQVINNLSNRHESELVDNESSEGLLLAYELKHAVLAIQETIKLNNLKLPKDTKKFISQLPPVKTGTSTRYKWSEDSTVRTHIDQTYF